MKFITLVKSGVFALALSALALSFDARAQKVSFENSSVVPGADGSVRVSRDKNKNSVINIQIKNLAEPDRLEPPRKQYIVWMVTDNDLTKNIGKIKSSRTMFNKRMEGGFETISSFTPVKIFITAEDEADIQYPQGEVILSTTKF
jgi:hypothetical protein